MTPPKPPTQNTLMPCPFCGADNPQAYTKEYESHYRHHIECVKCMASVSNAKMMRADAVYYAETAWNTRASQSPPCAEVVEWQPIETAPKDGTTVIISYPVLIRTDVNSLESCAYFRDGVWTFPYGGFTLSSSHAPTHWMPLPKPPALLGNNRVGG